MKMDNTVKRQIRKGGATYRLDADKELDGKFVEAGKVLKITPEDVIGKALSSFLNSYQSVLAEAIAMTGKVDTKH